MEPYYDGLYIMQILDFMALKAKEYSWMINFYNQYIIKTNFPVGLPNWGFSRALALFHLSRSTKVSNKIKVFFYLFIYFKEI